MANKIMKSKKLLMEAYKNATKDRNAVSNLMEEATKDFGEEDFDVFSHSRIGSTIAKYLESLARSNEQIIKIGSILNKKEEKEALSENEGAGDLFDRIIEQCENNEEVGN